MPTSGKDNHSSLAERGKSDDEPDNRPTDRFWGLTSVNKCAPGESSVRNVSDVAFGASCLSPSCVFSPAFLANGQVIEPRDSGKTLQKNMKMTVYEDRVESFRQETGVYQETTVFRSFHAGFLCILSLGCYVLTHAVVSLAENGRYMVDTSPYDA